MTIPITDEIKAALTELGLRRHNHLTGERLETFMAGWVSAIGALLGHEGKEYYLAQIHERELVTLANMASGKKTIFYPSRIVILYEKLKDDAGRAWLIGRPVNFVAEQLGLPCHWNQLQDKNSDRQRLVVVVDGVADAEKLEDLAYDNKWWVMQSRCE